MFKQQGNEVMCQILHGTTLPPSLGLLSPLSIKGDNSFIPYNMKYNCNTYTMFISVYDKLIWCIILSFLFGTAQFSLWARWHS